MRSDFRGFVLFAFSLVTALLALPARAQLGSSGSIEGTVVDPSGGAVANATVEIQYPVSGYSRTTTTGSDGSFRFTNVPSNPYHLTVKAPGFAPYVQDVEVRSAVPVTLQISLKVGAIQEQVTVEASASDLIETDSTFHTDVDRTLFEKLPLESVSSSVSSLVTLSSPGIAADSNGLFHGLGDHAENSFSVDGQPITDQQSKVFSNQIPIDSIQSLEVISGAPPAEYGDKTSVVIVATTRSGLGETEPHGTVTASYGSFGTGYGGFNLGIGGQSWGNFISANGLQTGRFLDPPEFTVMHAKGNETNVFDRVDYKPTKTDTLQFNFGYTRSWFQNPNSFDQQFHFGIANPVTGQPLGPTDQRSLIQTINLAPTWTRLFGSDIAFTVGGFVRRDNYHYYPSRDPFADFSPDLQSETIRQLRKLTNAGARSDFSYVKGIHNIKAGAVYQHTFLTENENFSIVDPGFLGSLGCLDMNGNPIPGSACETLKPFDLTRGGGFFFFHGHTDVKEFAAYLQDAITKGSWTFNLGLRGDIYNAISRAKQLEPRVGIAYNIKRTNTVMRVSYARILETPFNENLVIASTGCNIPVVAALIPPPGIPCHAGPITAGFRNEFHAGLQQAFGKYVVVDGEYIWKYTHNGFDFGIVGATPITFPIEWTKSKIPGYAVRVSVPNFHRFTGLVVFSGVAARFFLPQVAGVPIIGPGTSVFRIDHDEKFNQTTHLQYQPWQRGPWFAFNWRYDSGLVSGAIPCLAATATCAFSTSPADAPGIGLSPFGPGQVALVNDITGGQLTADQELQAGLTCNGQPAVSSPFSAPLTHCSAAGLGSTLLQIPGPFTENDDHKPQRIAARHLFDAAIGHDNLFHGDRFKWSLRFSVINLADKKTLYNFLSTFSGTHFVTPRTYTGELGFHF